MSNIPSPEKRRRATPKQIESILAGQGFCCAKCPIVLAEKDAAGFIRVLHPFDVDHVTPLDLLGNNGSENLQILCGKCHKDKSKRDVKAIAKARRLRGETSNQASRRAERGSQIKTHPKRIASAGFQKRPEGFKHSWPKRRMGK